MTSASTGPANVPNEEEITTRELFLICAALVGALVGLVILRFLVVLLIDVLILGDMASAKRSVVELAEKVCGCCLCLNNGRAVADGSDDQHDSNGRNDHHGDQQQDDIRRARRRSHRRTTPPPTENRPHTLASCSFELGMLQSLPLNEILPSRTMTQDDWEKLMKVHEQEQEEQQHHQQQELSHSDTLDSHRNKSKSTVVSEMGVATAVTCSICLQELRVGALVHETEMCRHWFHAACIREWLLVGATPRERGGSSHLFSNSYCNNHCPNCRSRLVDPAILSRELPRVEVNGL